MAEMSIWYYQKNKEGKRAVFSITIPLEVFIVFLGLVAALVVPRYALNGGQIGLDSFIMVGIGFMLVVVSKISVFRRGIWNSWGSRQMNGPFRWVYRCGYLLMLIGVFGLLVFYSAFNP